LLNIDLSASGSLFRQRLNLVEVLCVAARTTATPLAGAPIDRRPTSWTDTRQRASNASLSLATRDHGVGCRHFSRL
jgi:hypothetical protein